ncbi:MAG: excinuclease ABC subunit UvrC [bacterium]
MSRGESRAARRERLLAIARALPDEPGAYLFSDASGRVIYVGKAKSLRARVRSYFQDDLPIKTRRMVDRAHGLDSLVTSTELEALLLEHTLIKEHAPRYNVVYRDDKRYPYLKVTLAEPFPRVMPTRRLEDDGSRYFGPYADAGSMRRTLKLLSTLFPLPSCTIRLTEGMSDRGCLDWFLGRCVGPCRGDVAPEDYRPLVDEAIRFLEGKKTDVVADLERRMAEAAREMRYEEAAKLRDRLFSVRRTVSPQHVAVIGRGDSDVLGLSRLGKRATGVLLTVRAGKVTGRERLEIACTPDEPESGLVRGLLLGFYENRTSVPAEVLVPADPPDAELLAEWLTDVARRGVRVRVPQRGEGRRLLALAEHNAAVALGDEEPAGEGVQGARARDDAADLGRALGLETSPRRVEGFDISTIQGTDTYASMVVFEGGQPAKAEYRTFRIREAPRRDDPRAIGEAVGRRARRIAAGGAAPDLILIDGGPTQLSAASAALAGEALAIPIVSLAKREELVFFPGRAEPLRLPRESRALKLLQRVRDEAHRFALRAHRRRRGARVAASVLDEVPGIGPAKRKLLLQKFGSVAGIRDAGIDDIAAVPGVGRALALSIWTHLGGAEDR